MRPARLPTMRRTKLKQLEMSSVKQAQKNPNSLRDVILGLPRSEKAAFLFAYQQNRGFLLQETPPAAFVQCDDGDVQRAARRLTAYWRWRWNLFSSGGDPLSFLQPLRLNSLSNDVRDLLKMGHIVFLPADKQGRPVVCFDASRLDQLPSILYLQAAFYLWSVLCYEKQHRSVGDGYVGLIVLRSNSFLDETVQNWVDMIFESFPIHAACLHVLAGFGEFQYKAILHERILPRAIKVFGRLMREQEVMIHVQQDSDFTNELQPYGLLCHCLPNSVGGSWSYENWNSWLLDQEHSEQDELLFETAMATITVNERGTKEASAARPFEHSISEVVDEWEVEPLMLGKVRHEIGNASVELGSERVDCPERACAVPTPGSGDHLASSMSLDCALITLVDGDKVALEEALNGSAHLVEKESPWNKFVLYPWNDTPVGAALQLAKWWDVRKQLFGKKFLLPMTQTGEGALARKDIALLRSECIMWLPKDEHGRVVMYIDLIRMLNEFDERTVLRCLFYALHVANENASVNLVVLSPVGAGVLEWKGEMQLTLLWEVFPMTLNAMHCVLHNKSQMMAPPMDKLQRLFGLKGKESLIKVHRLTTAESLMIELLAQGFSKESLPTTFGGSFDSNRFSQYLELRVRIEWDLPAGTRNKGVLDMFDFSKVKRLADLSKLELIERKRRMNILHTRRKRDREQMEEAGMRERCNLLNNDNSRLRNDNARLERMLMSAIDEMGKLGVAAATLPQHPPRHRPEMEPRRENHGAEARWQPLAPESPINREVHKRSMNRLYSQRKRDRERKTIETLIDECNVLSDRNRALLVDNIWMEDIVHSALAEVSRLETS